MHEMYELRDKLCDELKEVSKNGVSSGNLGMIDTLAHAVKNIDKIIEVDEMDGGYSNTYPDGMGGSYRRGMSYARKRDSMGRYSRDGEDVESIKREVKRLSEKVAMM